LRETKTQLCWCSANTPCRLKITQRAEIIFSFLAAAAAAQRRFILGIVLCNEYACINIALPSLRAPASINFSLLPFSRAGFGCVCCGQSIAPESPAACCMSAARNLRQHFSRLRVDKSAINFIFRGDNWKKTLAFPPLFAAAATRSNATLFHVSLCSPSSSKAGVCVTCKIRSN
jgi:hypothetical protein